MKFTVDIYKITGDFPETQLLIAIDLNYISSAKEVLKTLSDIRKMVSGLLKHLKQKS